MAPDQARPPLSGVLEACLYHAPAEREAVERFYAELLELPAVARWPDGIAFRAGATVLLLFDRDRVAAGEGPIKDHGAGGPGHACLLTDPAGYEAWKARVAGAGIAITHEQSWGAQRRSFYFKDPASNLLEIADGDLWPPASEALG